MKQQENVIEENCRPELITSFKAGDPEAFKEIHRIYSRALCYFVSKITGDSIEADDIVSESFRKLWQRRDYMNSLINVKAFLYIACRNSAIDYLRFVKKQKDSKDAFAQQIETSEDKIVNTIVQAEILEEVYKEIENLPEKEKCIMKLHFAEGMSLKEIAEKLNSSQQLVRVTKFRTLQKIRKTMSKRHLLPLMLTISALNLH